MWPFCGSLHIHCFFSGAFFWTTIAVRCDTNTTHNTYRAQKYERGCAHSTIITQRTHSVFCYMHLIYFRFYVDFHSVYVECGVWMVFGVWVYVNIPNESVIYGCTLYSFILWSFMSSTKCVMWRYMHEWADIPFDYIEDDECKGHFFHDDGICYFGWMWAAAFFGLCNLFARISEFRRRSAYMNGMASIYCLKSTFIYCYILVNHVSHPCMK